MAVAEAGIRHARGASAPRATPRWPKVERATAARSLELARRLSRLPAHARACVPGIGTLALSLERVVPEGRWERPPGGAWSGAASFLLSHDRGDVLVELAPVLARLVLARMLPGVPAAPPGPARALTPVELGAVAAAVTRAIELLPGLGPSVRVRPAAGDPFAGRAPTWALLRAGLGEAPGVAGEPGAIGLVRVAWLPDGPAEVCEPATALLARTPFAAVVEAGVTRLPWPELARAVAGDVLAFVGTPATPPGAGRAARPVSLRLGAARAPGVLGPDGTLSLIGPFTLHARSAAGLVASATLRPNLGNRPMHEPPADPSAVTTTTQPAGDPVTVPAGTPPEPDALDVPLDAEERIPRVLAQAPVEIVAELARLTLTGAEVSGLRAGLVLGLGCGATPAVSLTAAGQVVARGTLVDLDGELGVEISELLL